MNLDRQIWESWAAKLHKWGLSRATAACLEAAGPLSIVGAQLVYMLHPFLGRSSAQNSVEALAAMLEEPARVDEFVRILREETQA